MTKYFVDFTDKAKEHIEQFKKAGNKFALKKIDVLLEELRNHPKTGTGKPEQLKGYPNRWSRRITDKHRLVYEIHDEVVVVLVLSAYGHYKD